MSYTYHWPDWQDWQVDKEYQRILERIQYERQNLHDLKQWCALEEDIASCEAELASLVSRRGAIRSEMASRGMMLV